MQTVIHGLVISPFHWSHKCFGTYIPIRYYTTRTLLIQAKLLTGQWPFSTSDWIKNHTLDDQLKCLCWIAIYLWYTCPTILSGTKQEERFSLRKSKFSLHVNTFEAALLISSSEFSQGAPGFLLRDKGTVDSNTGPDIMCS